MIWSSSDFWSRNQLVLRWFEIVLYMCINCLVFGLDGTAGQERWDSDTRSVSPIVCMGVTFGSECLNYGRDGKWTRHTDSFSQACIQRSSQVPLIIMDGNIPTLLIPIQITDHESTVSYSPNFFNLVGYRYSPSPVYVLKSERPVTYVDNNSCCLIKVHPHMNELR